MKGGQKGDGKRGCKRREKTEKRLMKRRRMWKENGGSWLNGGT
jgi:hypothetical protein